MKYKFKLILLLFLTSWLTACGDADEGPIAQPPASKGEVDFWLTNADKSVLFTKQSGAINFKSGTNSFPTITIDTTTTYQQIDGFGFTLTSGSAQVLSQMGNSTRSQLLKELFGDTETNIGISYLRLNIGASDLSANVYSYNDLPAGQTDPTLANFSLEPDRAYYLPVLKEILAINPAIKLLATPWSPPTWMKTNNSTIGGNLKSEYYDAYALYLVKYIQAMRAEGITIDAITLQNEPLHDGNNPSMYMSAADQASFIKNNIGPALQQAGLTTKIIIYDHNADKPEYPLAILNDAQAKPYVDGSAFHLYAGDISALSQVRTAHPDKNIYFTEQYTGTSGSFGGDLSWHTKNLIVGATRNWSRNVLEWNLAANQNNGPYTNGGCNTCLPGVTIGNSVTRNVAYYIIAHASKFVRPGSVRVASNITGSLQNVAFKTPDGKKVLIVLNEGTAAQSFNIAYKGKLATATLNGGAVGTFVW
ncbi:glycoside hydrolase family 30 beta sandwich domain-containing protein [Pontibacter sp. SGAir0037]|uniref:glycoside hydrolase family 30 protein n=1 Tax=Pontibacter sp. SGAir0037 TaxID=2571030 RepID=UPI0010CCF582|nr:glycoside hydrolase family 30 beta sandwich domain-containing protein [Pontibacter sp. SGAir0037]QCR25073.1 glucosylceramidase [Pontibacter sp. SGAir0037]